jgi:hypothetical protein
MTLITTLTLVHETKESAHYAEAEDQDQFPILGTVSVQKWALPRPTPSTIRLVLEPYEAVQPPALSLVVGMGSGAGARVTPETGETGTGEAGVRDAGAGTSALRKGASVRIVKNRLAGIHQPPEWLEQYLGRRGIVLWTTAGGAMVQLESGATWFPYAELEVEG